MSFQNTVGIKSLINRNCSSAVNDKHFFHLFINSSAFTFSIQLIQFLEWISFFCSQFLLFHFYYFSILCRYYLDFFLFPSSIFILSHFLISASSFQLFFLFCILLSHFLLHCFCLPFLIAHNFCRFSFLFKTWYNSALLESLKQSGFKSCKLPTKILFYNQFRFSPTEKNSDFSSQFYTEKTIRRKQISICISIRNISIIILYYICISKYYLTLLQNIKHR